MRAKKIAIISVVVLLIAVTIIYFLYEQQRRQSLEVTVPSYTQGVLRVNAAQLLRKNFFKLRKDSVGKSGSTGLKIPFNIFAWQASNHQKTVWLTAFAIKDTALFSAFRALHFPANTTLQLQGSQVYKHNVYPFYCIYNAERAVFTFGDPSPVVQTVNDLLAAKGVTIKRSNFAGLLHAKADAAYVSGNGQADLSFTDQVLDISAEMPNTFTLDAPPYHLMADTSAAAYLSAATRLPQMVSSYLAERFDGLSADTLQAGFLNGCYMQVKGSTRQQKTVVKYTYDDDFQKEETTTTEDSEVPAFLLQARVAENLCSYLRQGHLLLGDSINREVFPLYALYGACSGSSLAVSTSRNDLRLQPVYTSVGTRNTFMKGVANFKILRKAPEWQSLHLWFAYLDTLTLDGEVENDKLHCKATITFSEKAPNAFVAMLKMLGAL